MFLYFLKLVTMFKYLFYFKTISYNTYVFNFISLYIKYIIATIDILKATKRIKVYIFNKNKKYKSTILS